VSNKEPYNIESKTGMIVGIVVAVAILGILAVLSILFWRNLNKKKDMEEGIELSIILRT
jgi:Tfp pilus assembly protein PilE